MKFEQVEFKNDIYCEALRCPRKASGALFLFHGYPAEGGEKNRDIAQGVSTNCPVDSFIIHYPGLGKSKGKFDFVSSVNCSHEFLKKYSIKYKEIYLYGHSWGGQIALSALSQLDHYLHIKKLILASPFSIIPEHDKDLNPIVKNVYDETFDLLKHHTFSEVLEQIKLIRTLYNPDDIVKLVVKQKIQTPYIPSPLKIGPNVGIQMNVTIPKGIEIGENSIIAANTVLRENVEPNSLVFTNNKLRIKHGYLSGLDTIKSFT